MNINKFTQKSLQAVQQCEKIAMEYGNQEIEQEHLMYALLTQDDSLILKLMQKMGLYLRRNNKTKLEVSIDEPLNVDWDGNELLLSDILGTDEDVIYKDIENEMERKLLNKAILKLSERERTIVELRFGLKHPLGMEMTQKEVADLLGISQSYISRLEKKIIKRLKKEILKYE